MKGIGLAALGVLAALPLGGDAWAQQADSGKTARAPGLCWRGRPLPTCRSFWLTEVSAEYAFATTTTRYRYDYGTFVNEHDQADVSSRVLWTVGPMFNTGPARALGATISAGPTNQGTRLAIEARRRWWLGSDAADVSAGLLRLDIPPQQSGGSANAYGLTTGGYFVGGDIIQVNARFDLVFGKGRPRAGGTVGAGLGSYAAAGATLLAGLVAVIAVAAIVHGTYD